MYIKSGTHLFHPNVRRHDLVLQVLKKKAERRHLKIGCPEAFYGLEGF